MKMDYFGKTGHFIEMIQSPIYKISQAWKVLISKKMSSVS